MAAAATFDAVIIGAGFVMAFISAVVDSTAPLTVNGVSFDTGGSRVTFASGMAAMTAALLCQLRTGDHVVTAKAAFGSGRGSSSGGISPLLI